MIRWMMELIRQVTSLFFTLSIARAQWWPSIPVCFSILWQTRWGTGGGVGLACDRRSGRDFLAGRSCVWW